MNATPGRTSLLAAAVLISLLQLRPRMAWVEAPEAAPRDCARLLDAHAFQEAQECFAVRVRQQPADAVALFYLGRTYHERRQAVPAIDWVRQYGLAAKARQLRNLHSLGYL